MENMFGSSTNIAIVDCDSSYIRRHGAARFRGERIPLGAVVDFMPQGEAKLESVANKTMQGVFIAHHVHAGGVWSGDDYVAEQPHSTRIAMW